MKLYQDYDRQALEAQYNLRRAVPDHQIHFDRWAAESAYVRRALDATLDVSYGGSPSQKLDVFPTAAPDAPILLFIHGGYWQAFDKGFFHHLAPAFVQAGICFVANDYVLGPHGTMDEIVEQNREAVAWLSANAARFGADGSRIFVAGHSAGGHLTACILATDWQARGLAFSPVVGGCAISGVFDLEPIRHTYLNDKLGMDLETAWRNSPLHRPPAAAAPLWLAVGELETDEFHRQQADFAARWAAPSRPVEVIDMPGLHHFNVVDRLGEAGSPLFRAVRDHIAGRPAREP